MKLLNSLAAPTRIAFALIAAAAATSVGTAADTATLKGHFVYDAAVPTPEKVVVTKDAEVCGKHNLVKEGLVVGKDGGIKNIGIWLLTKGITPPADLAKVPTEPAVLDNKNCRFEPHMLFLRTGQPLEVLNSDSVGHNTMVTPKSNKPFNDLIPSQGKIKIVTFTKPESRPFEVKCSIHPWMNAWIIVQDGPYAAVTDESGNFEIKGLPAGKELQFQVWQERAGYVKDVILGGKPTKWGFGRFKQTLKPGDNDLGEIKVPSSAFQK